MWALEFLAAAGVRQVVCSPGSRNSPLIIALTADERFTYTTLGDERAAAFHALGAAVATGRPVAVMATSGSAIANYYPAVLEAFYSHQPLVVITADRPQDSIGIGAGQTCVQPRFFEPHIGASVHLDEAAPLEAVREQFNEALEQLSQTRLPVHINLSFDEPLYERAPAPPELHLSSGRGPASDTFAPFAGLHPATAELVATLNPREEWAFVAGQLSPTEGQALRRAMSALPATFTFYADPASGLLDHPQSVPLTALLERRPDVLVSVGGQWVDKHPKVHLQQHPPRHHVHVHPYQCWNVTKTQVVHLAQAVEVWTSLASVYEGVYPPSVSFPNGRFHHFAADLPWSDALAFATAVQCSDAFDTVHLGNSTAVRYAHWFPLGSKLQSNRGIAGIDGSLSTAVGAATARPDQRHLCILGDQSFIYDSNALYVNPLPANLTVLVLNNGVGEIFNWLPGMAALDAQAQRVLRNPQQVNLGALAAAFGARHERVVGKEALESALLEPSEQLRVLEAWTVDAPNTEVFKELKRRERHE